MDPSEQCPEPGTWKTFLDGELLDEASADLTAHLEECEACQQTLERLAAGKETWEGTAKQLAEADANAEQLESSGHLRDVLNDLKRGIEIDSRAANITPESLTFLSESDQDDSIGRLGSYEVLEIVGAGGMGIVMRAWDPSLRRIVAIKVLASHLSNSAAVSHDHVVAIHAVEADHEPPYLVMQYIEGKTLQQRLDGAGPLHVREVLRIGQQTALGLAAAHQQGIVHRDIKPANILLENGVERVRITDFGLARAIDDASMTQSGVVAGTPLFMAPEQAQGLQLDHRADLFSLGSVLYVICTGRPPFRSSTMIGVIRRVCDDSPRPIREINPDVPDWLCAIIDRLLAKVPQDRYGSAEEVATLLGNCLAHVQQPTIVPLPEGIAASTASVVASIDSSTIEDVSGETVPTQAVSEPDVAGALADDAKPVEQHLVMVPVTPADIRHEVSWPSVVLMISGIANVLLEGWRARLYFPLGAGEDVVEILDFWHFLERLREVSKLLCDTDAAAETFVKERLTRVLAGDLGRVIGGLRQMLKKRRLGQKRLLSKKSCATISSAITYFENNRSRMRYGDYLREGYPIASGIIEGLCRLVVEDRLDRTSMRWSLEGALAMHANPTTRLCDYCN
ncbi:MAG: protein kinase domain-containing protein [Planctomycetales bacterium]